MNFSDLPDFSETFVSCFGHSTFLEHVITYLTENLKLFFSGECICPITIFHDVEHLTFGSNHEFQSRM